MSDIKEAKKTCKDVLISDATRSRLLHQEEGLTTIQGLDIDKIGMFVFQLLNSHCRGDSCKLSCKRKGDEAGLKVTSF